MITIVGHNLQIDRPIYEILQVSGISLLDKTPVKELFNKSENQYVKEQNYNQLYSNFFLVDSSDPIHNNIGIDPIINAWLSMIL